MRLSLSMDDVELLYEALQNYSYHMRELAKEEDDSDSKISLEFADDADRIQNYLERKICKEQGFNYEDL
jgi:hypothetical protein